MISARHQRIVLYSAIAILVLSIVLAFTTRKRNQEAFQNPNVLAIKAPAAKAPAAKAPAAKAPAAKAPAAKAPAANTTPVKTTAEIPTKCKAIKSDEINKIKSNVVTDLNILNNYENNQDAQSTEYKKKLEATKKNMNEAVDFFVKLFNNRTTCIEEYIDCMNTYAVKRGFLGKTSEQGSFEAVQIGTQLFGYYLVVRAENPNLDYSRLKNIQVWIGEIMTRYGSTFGGRSNNQFLYYVGPIMFAAMLYGGDIFNNTTFSANRKSQEITAQKAEIIKMKDLLVKHMTGNFKQGFIKSELDRHHKTIKYHSYYVNILWPILIFIKIFKIPFPWNNIKNDLKLVCDVLSSPNVLTLFRERLKPVYSAEVLQNMQKISDGDKNLKMYNYIFDTTGKIAVPSGYMLTGVSVSATQFVNALNAWKESPSLGSAMIF